MVSKKSYRITSVTLAVAFALFADCVSGIPVTPLDVAALTNGADLIVVGRIASVANEGRETVEVAGNAVSAARDVASLQVEKVIKGEPGSPSLSFHFWISDAPTGFQSISVGQYGMFFLKHNQSAFHVVDPLHALLPALPGLEMGEGSPLDKVTNVLVQVLVAPGATQAEELGALDALTSIRTQSAADGLRGALKTTTDQLRLRIAARLVARNDLAGLGPVADALLHPVGLSSQLTSELAGSLAGLRDPRSVAILTQLLETGDQRVIQGVAIALRQSHSHEALEPLSVLLNNSQQTVRYYAVAGMGEITGQDKWTPAFDEFREHETSYISHWQEWAASNLGRGAP